MPPRIKRQWQTLAKKERKISRNEWMEQEGKLHKGGPPRFEALPRKHVLVLREEGEALSPARSACKALERPTGQFWERELSSQPITPLQGLLTARVLQGRRTCPHRAGNLKWEEKRHVTKTQLSSGSFKTYLNWVPSLGLDLKSKKESC